MGGGRGGGRGGEGGGGGGVVGGSRISFKDNGKDEDEEGRGGEG